MEIKIEAIITPKQLNSINAIVDMATKETNLGVLYNNLVVINNPMLLIGRGASHIWVSGTNYNKKRILLIT